MIVGSQIGPYRIERMLGEGGMGVLYVGVDVHLGRHAAIKQLLPELSRRRDIVDRFLAEAKAAANINHPGIVPIYGGGWHSDGSAYFAMKLLDGDTLAKRLHAGPMPLATACTVAQQIASALDAAHTAGIVHRDVKPDNIILVRDDAIKPLRERAIVLDFGIAKLTGDWMVSHRTRTGSMMGTLLYMSPEQCQNSGEVDHRTDVYSTGCILFEMLTGRRPFEGPQVIADLLLEAPPSVRSLRPDVSLELEALVMRCLAKQPDQRYQTMTKLIDALESCLPSTGLANEAVLSENGASPVVPPVSGSPTPLLRRRKLSERELPEPGLADRGPPGREPSERELSEGEPPERVAAEAPARERGPDDPVEDELVERIAVQASAGGPRLDEPVEREPVEQASAGERRPDDSVEGEPVGHVAVQAPAGEPRPGDPVEGEAVERDVGNRGEVATPQRPRRIVAPILTLAILGSVLGLALLAAKQYLNTDSIVDAQIADTDVKDPAWVVVPAPTPDVSLGADPDERDVRAFKHGFPSPPEHRYKIEIKPSAKAGMTWEDAKRACEEKGDELPTEAEWEWAVRSNVFPLGGQEWTNNVYRDNDGTKAESDVQLIAVRGVPEKATKVPRQRAAYREARCDRMIAGCKDISRIHFRCVRKVLQ